MADRNQKKPAPLKTFEEFNELMKRAPAIEEAMTLELERVVRDHNRLRHPKPIKVIMRPPKPIPRKLTFEQRIARVVALEHQIAIRAQIEAVPNPPATSAKSSFG
jgi:hypothetical protein